MKHTHILAAFALVAFACSAQAAPLAVTCQDPTADGVQVNAYPAGCNTITLKTPLPVDLVRVDPTKAVGGFADWTSANYRWKAWSKLAAGETYEACKDNVPDGTTDWRLCVDYGFVAKTATVITPGTVTVSWAPPTTYTDGTPITEPILYNVYRGAAATSLALLKANAVSPYVDSGMASGTYFYTVTAVTTGGESAKPDPQSTTVTAPKLIPGPPKSISVTVTVTVP